MGNVTITGGTKWKAYLERLAEKAEVRAGVLNAATNDDGRVIAEYAAYNEFGAVINVPQRTRALYFRQRRDGSVDNRFVKKDKSNFVQDAVIPAHTITIPPRPFMRRTLENKRREWVNGVAALLKKGMSPEEALKEIGRWMKEDIQATIKSNMEPPNAPSTVARKNREEAGRAGTLVDTGALVKAISYEVTR